MKIAFVGYEEANLGCIAPVMAALQRGRVADPIFIPGIDFKPHRGLHTARPPAGVVAREPASVLAPAQRRAAQRRGSALVQRARRWAAAPPADASAAEHLGAAELRALFGLAAMPEIFAAYATVARAAAEILRRERPRLVVVSEDSDYLRGRLLARIVAAHGGRVVCLSPWYYSVFLNYPMIGDRRAHHFLVGTRVHARRLVAAGAPRDAITVVGHPELDALAPTAVPPPGRFLFALQGRPWEPEIAADLVAIVAGEPGARLVIRPHPALPRPAWLDELAPPRNVRVASPTASAAALLGRAHCVIAQTSRMLWEASLRGRSVIVPHYAATPLPIAVPARDRAAVVARSGVALRQRVRATLADGGRGLTRTVIAPHHPHATARVVAALRALLRAA